MSSHNLSITGSSCAGDPHSTLERIIDLRDAIRYHRAQISDYRCWVDDERLYKAAGGDISLPVVPKPEEFLNRCEHFWDHRQRAHEQGTGDPSVSSAERILQLPVYANDDLAGNTEDELTRKLSELTAGIESHQRKGFDGRTVRDDEALYALLPEQVLWNSGLPKREIFLANCARFCGHCQERPEHILEWSDH